MKTKKIISLLFCLPHYCKPLAFWVPYHHFCKNHSSLFQLLMELKPAPSLPEDGYGLTRTYASSIR